LATARVITGSVNAHREAIVCLTVRGPQAQDEVEAVVDTGFSGYLTLPLALIATLDLPFRRPGRAVLADGSETLFDVYEAEVAWDERPRRVFVDAADTDPLVGMALLEDHELTVRVVNEGDVFIRASS
jgi:clan AA aspartic protease